MADYAVHVSTRQLQVIESACRLMQGIFSSAKGMPAPELFLPAEGDEGKFLASVSDICAAIGQMRLYETYGEHEVYEAVSPVGDEPLPVIVRKRVRV